MLNTETLDIYPELSMQIVLTIFQTDKSLKVRSN